ncbi:MAG: hypothetical protein AB2792_10005 [Candidatus Thiodiazotropha sp.]
MDQRYLRTSVYFFVAIFLMFLFIDDKTLLIVLIALAGLLWIIIGFISKDKTDVTEEEENNEIK